jgi:nucleoside phosphorylase/CheY-like chemotaxis protein
MKILLLEDNPIKMNSIVEFIESIDASFQIDKCECFSSFMKLISSYDYDLIIIDLIIPPIKGAPEASDLSKALIEAIRDHECRNYRKPVIALTGFLAAAESNFVGLNAKDISVITFSEQSDDWKEALRSKISDCLPPLSFDFIIFCALTKEVNGFIDAGYEVNDPELISGLRCRKLTIGEHSGVIVESPRMGLVCMAITCSRAIEIFRPKLVCMSGICAGIKGAADIYDVVISDICHQHDFGKWDLEGFQPEQYNVQISNEMRLKICQIIEDRKFKESIIEGIHLTRNEFVPDKDVFSFGIKLGATSSGSSVVADDGMLSTIKKQHRKMTAFEMESFAVYESARLSPYTPSFFSAKSVVDNGDKHKGDFFHRVACILSAKVVYNLIAKGGGFV